MRFNITKKNPIFLSIFSNILPPPLLVFYLNKPGYLQDAHIHRLALVQVICFQFPVVPKKYIFN